MNKINLNLEIYHLYQKYKKQKEWERKWKEKHPDRIKEYNRKYYNSHRLYWKLYRLNKKKYLLGSESTYLIYHSNLNNDLSQKYLHNLAEKIRNKSK
ncbi:MAG: hypothetical protein QXV17_07300 [Candidatus Micrarchaeaceae archaeon]